MAELTWSSPKGKFRGAGKEISESLGRKPESTDLNERHPFDVEILRIPPGKAPYSYHAHSAQWEFYHVISGSGIVRHHVKEHVFCSVIGDLMWLTRFENKCVASVNRSSPILMADDTAA